MGTKKLKLLIFSKNLDGGTGTFLSQILKLKKNFQIVVCSLERSRFRQANDHGFNFFQKNPGYLSYYKLDLLLLIQIVREFLWLRKIIMRERPEVTLSIDTHSNLIALAAKEFVDRKIKSIVTTHNNLSAVVAAKLSPPLRLILKSLGGYFFNKADAVVCVSDGVGKNLVSFFSLLNKVRIIRYGLNSARIKKLETKPLNNEHKAVFDTGRTIISIGRFEEQKDFTTLIKAFCHVKMKIRDLDLVLIGEGEQREMLEDLVRKLKIRDCVHFLGWQKNVYPYLRSSDLFVLSSNYEGFGYVLLEAMSQGIPVISTDSPFGPREVLGGGEYGLLVPVGNVGKLSDAILTILQDKNEYKKYSLKSCERIKHFTEEKMLKSYEDLIKGLF